MRRTSCRLAAQQYTIDRPPLIQITNGTFYRQHPSSKPVEVETSSSDSNPPLFPGLNFTLPSFSSKKEHWSVLSSNSAARTTFLQVLRGQHLCFPPTARSYPYLATNEIAKKDPKLRSPFHAIQYVGFDAERGRVGGSGMRGAYLSARYESRKEETDFSLQDFLLGNTELNADERLINHPDGALLGQVMNDLKLDKMGDMPVSHLSNGQTRRARIAKALLARPEVLLLDGPFMGLDPSTLQLLSSLLHQLAEAQAPRLILSLKPDEHIPEWITHMAFVTRHFKLNSIGTREEVVSGIHKRYNEIKRMEDTAESRSMPTEDDVEIAEVSRHIQSRESVRTPKGWTKEDVRSYQRERRLILNEGEEGGKPKRVIDESKINHHTENTIKHAPGEHPKLSRDGFPPKNTPPEPSGEPLVEMKGVKVKYGEKAVLGEWEQEVEGEKKDGLWWNICRGQRWGVFGPNGSGKTTLISLITSDHPQTYSLPVTLFGKSRLPQLGQPGISIFDIQSRIGHSSPEVHVFFPKHLSLRRTLESAWADTPLTKPRLTHDIDEKVSATLQWFRGELHPSLGPTELQKAEMTRKSRFDESYPSARPGTVSPYILRNSKADLINEEQDPHSVDWADALKFGEMSFSAQRVALFLRAVIRNPDLVILDEAFSGMDDFARDKCHLFLSRGESAIFRYRTHQSNVLIRQSGPRPMESDISRVGRVKVHGLQKEQALIVVSHKKEEVPGCVREWICLPEAGEGMPPRVGQLSGPLELGVSGWREIWGNRVLNAGAGKTVRSRREPKTPEMLEEWLRKRSEAQKERLKNETAEQRAKRLAKEKEKYLRRKAIETEEQRERRLARNKRNRKEKQAKKKAMCEAASPV